MLHDVKVKVILPEFKLSICHNGVVIFNYNQICQLLQSYGNHFLENKISNFILIVWPFKGQGQDSVWSRVSLTSMDTITIQTLIIKL